MREFLPFENQPPIDWSKKENQKRMKESLKRIRKSFGKDYPLVIGKDKISISEKISSFNPANFKERIGQVSQGFGDLIKKSTEIAYQSWLSWREVPYQKRAQILFEAAKILREKRFEAQALCVYEIGKNWIEADADVAEAIDFLEYYGKRMIELGGGEVLPGLPVELNTTEFLPRGVVAVIGIWNFAWAINVGMIAAPIVTGNTVVFKPSSLSPIIGYQIFEIFSKAGLPEGVLNFLPGKGKEIGEELVKDPLVIGVAVTGSKQTGQVLHQICGNFPCDYGFKQILVGEFGGKDLIYLEPDCDLDQALEGVLWSFLGYQNQKCSACSVLLLHQDIYSLFLERFREAVDSIKIGPPEDPSNLIGPLIDDQAKVKAQKYFEIGKKEGRLIYQGKVDKQLEEIGYFFAPAIFEVESGAKIATEEIFAPILAVIKVKDFNQALEIFRQNQYALTGGVFTRSPALIEKAKKLLKYEVGNLYINRKITGALVKRQPFGGWRFSGVGSKAGGKYYLLRFVYESSISENLIRKGYVPTKNP